jgi:hypothetical protein
MDYDAWFYRMTWIIRMNPSVTVVYRELSAWRCGHSLNHWNNILDACGVTDLLLLFKVSRTMAGLVSEYLCQRPVLLFWTAYRLEAGVYRNGSRPRTVRVIGFQLYQKYARSAVVGVRNVPLYPTNLYSIEQLHNQSAVGIDKYGTTVLIAGYDSIYRYNNKSVTIWPSKMLFGGGAIKRQFSDVKAFATLAALQLSTVCAEVYPIRLDYYQRVCDAPPPSGPDNQVYLNFNLSYFDDVSIMGDDMQAAVPQIPRGVVSHLDMGYTRFDAFDYDSRLKCRFTYIYRTNDDDPRICYQSKFIFQPSVPNDVMYPAAIGFNHNPPPGKKYHLFMVGGMLTFSRVARIPKKDFVVTRRYCRQRLTLDAIHYLRSLRVMLHDVHITREQIGEERFYSDSDEERYDDQSDDDQFDDVLYIE